MASRHRAKKSKNGKRRTRKGASRQDDDDKLFDDYHLPEPSASPPTGVDDIEPVAPVGSADSEPEDDAPEVKGSQWHWYNLLRLRSQISLSILAGVAAAVVTARFAPTFARLGDLMLFMTVLLGVASVLALVASITFGFLLHYTESLVAEKNTLYAAFRGEVKELRGFLETMHDRGLIDSSFDFEMGRLEEITLENYPYDGWDEIVHPLVELVQQQEDVLSEDEFGPILRGIYYRLNHLNDVTSGMFKNFIGEQLVSRMTEPVLKAFGALAAVMLAVLLAPLTFDVVGQPVSWGVNAALGYFTVVLLVELALNVKREMGQFSALSSRK